MRQLEGKVDAAAAASATAPTESKKRKIERGNSTATIEDSSIGEMKIGRGNSAATIEDSSIGESNVDFVKLVSAEPTAAKAASATDAKMVVDSGHVTSTRAALDSAWAVLDSDIGATTKGNALTKKASAASGKGAAKEATKIASASTVRGAARNAMALTAAPTRRGDGTNDGVDCSRTPEMGGDEDLEHPGSVWRGFEAAQWLKNKLCHCSAPPVFPCFAQRAMKGDWQFPTRHQWRLTDCPSLSLAADSMGLGGVSSL